MMVRLFVCFKQRTNCCGELPSCRVEATGLGVAGRCIRQSIDRAPRCSRPLVLGTHHFFPPLLTFYPQTGPELPRHAQRIDPALTVVDIWTCMRSYLSIHRFVDCRHGAPTYLANAYRLPGFTSFACGASQCLPDRPVRENDMLKTAQGRIPLLPQRRSFSSAPHPPPLPFLIFLSLYLSIGDVLTLIASSRSFITFIRFLFSVKQTSAQPTSS